MMPFSAARGRSPSRDMAYGPSSLPEKMKVTEETNDIPLDDDNDKNLYEVDARQDDEIAIRECSALEPTVLYELIKSRKWSAVVNRLRNQRCAVEEAATWIVERNVDDSVRWKLLPLHQACENQAPSELIRALLDIHPPSVLMKDSAGDLPLHLACRERASFKTICLLVETDPDAAKVVDEEGRLPLHLACRQGAGHDIVNVLLEYHFRAARTQDAYQLLPLHWACAQNANPDVIESLLRANPEAVEVKDQWGRSPSSLAVASTNPQKETVLEYLDRDASYWTSSLLHKVRNLEKEVGNRTESEARTFNKATNLEEKLAEVSAASTLAAQSFRELKEELVEENMMLKNKVRSLTKKHNKSEETIKRLDVEKTETKQSIKELKMKLGALSELFRHMEEQRLSILKVTGDWEDALHRATDLTS